jgi:hypothetical protein
LEDVLWDQVLLLLSKCCSDYSPNSDSESDEDCNKGDERLAKLHIPQPIWTMKRRQR